MVISINKIGGKSEQGKYKKPNKEPKKKSVIILGDSMESLLIVGRCPKDKICKLYVGRFAGAKVQWMGNYKKPSMRALTRTIFKRYL